MPTIFEIDESWTGRSGSANAQSGRVLVRTFEVWSDDPAGTDAVAVVNAVSSVTGIFVSVAHPSWSHALCTDITATPTDEPDLWTVIATYEEPALQPGTLGGGGTGGPEGSSAPPEPADRSPKITLDSRRQPVYLTEDLDGNTLTNTADDPLEDAPPVNLGAGAINFTRYYESWSFTLGVLMIDKVNNDIWEGFPVDTLKIDGTNAELKTERGRVFWEVRIVVLYNPLKWIPTKLLNVGRRAYPRPLPVLPAVKIKTPIVDEFGRETHGQSLLNNLGQVYRPDLEAMHPGLDFRFYNRMSFAGL